MPARITKLLLLSAAVALICTFAFADLGNFNDYGSSGGWKGGSSSSGGGYSGGGSSGGSYSGWDRGSSDLRDGDLKAYMFFMLVVLTVAGISVFVTFLMNKAEDKVFGTGYSDEFKTAPGAADYTTVIARAIWEHDPDFSVDKFLSWAKEVFITLQTAWSERDWEKARPFEKEELYRQHELQIKEYIDKGRVNVLERINVNNADLYRYRRDAQYEYLTVFMNVRMVDYIMDEKTREVLKGDPDKDCFLSYMLTFIRKKGVLTAAAQTLNAVSCPKCGAPANVTSAGRCGYCGFIVKTGDYSWVLADIEGVKPGAGPGPGGVITNDEEKI